MSNKKKKSIYESIRKETAPPSRTFRTRKDELPRKAKHKSKVAEREECEHPNKIRGRSWAIITVVDEYYCPDCGKEWSEDQGY